MILQNSIEACAGRHDLFTNICHGTKTMYTCMCDGRTADRAMSQIQSQDAKSGTKLSPGSDASACPSNL